VLYAFQLSAATLTFEELQAPITNRTPERIHFYDQGDGSLDLFYKLTDSESPGSIFTTGFMSNSWTNPADTDLLNQASNDLFGVTTLSPGVSMILLRGDSTDYTRILGISDAPPEQPSEDDPVLADMSNDDLSRLLDTNQRLFTVLGTNQHFSQPIPIPGSNRAQNAIISSNGSGTALAVFIRDSDRIEETLSDIELFYAFYSNGAWSQAVQMTSNTVLEFNIKVVTRTEGFLISWMVDEDGDLTTGSDSRLHYATITSNGSVDHTPSTVLTQTNQEPFYLIDTVDGVPVLAWIDSQNSEHRIAETQFIGGAWTTIRLSPIPDDKLTNARFESYRDARFLLYQRGETISVLKDSGTSWDTVLTLDGLAGRDLDFHEIVYKIVGDRLWVAYSGHTHVVDQEYNPEVGSGLYVASHPLGFDLAIESVDLKNRYLTIGMQAPLTITVSNRGVLDSEPIDLYLRLNGDLYNNLSLGSVVAGGTLTFDYPVIVFDHQVEVGLDLHVYDSDTNPMNNTVSKLIKITPDFFIKQVTKVDATHIEVDVRERKGIPATTVPIIAYLQQNDVQTELASVEFDPSNPAPLMFTLPSLAGLNGDYKVVFVVNPNREVEEDSFSNNRHAYVENIEADADYVINDLRITDQHVEIDLSNRGALNTDSVDLLLTDDAVQAVDIANQSNPWYLQSISFDTEGNANLAIPLASLPMISSQSLYAAINPYRTIAETNLNNNRLHVLVISTSGIQPDSVTLSLLSHNYSCGNLTFNIKNSGAVKATSVKVSLKNSTGFPIATSVIPFLGIGESSSIIFKNISLGTYSLAISVPQKSAYVEKLTKSITLSGDSCVASTTRLNDRN
jgi:hypothetical protein